MVIINKAAIISTFIPEDYIPIVVEEVEEITEVISPVIRKFGVTDIWGIRKNQRYFSIFRDGLY